MLFDHGCQLLITHSTATYHRTTKGNREGPHWAFVGSSCHAESRILLWCQTLVDLLGNVCSRECSGYLQREFWRNCKHIYSGIRIYKLIRKRRRLYLFQSQLGVPGGLHLPPNVQLQSLPRHALPHYFICIRSSPPPFLWCHSWAPTPTQHHLQPDSVVLWAADLLLPIWAIILRPPRPDNHVQDRAEQSILDGTSYLFHSGMLL